MMRELELGSSRAILSPQKGLPLVTLTIGIRVGSACDPADRAGRFRYMIKAMRRGAGSYTADDIDQRLDLLGAELKVEVYATHTLLIAQVLSRNLDALVELVTDIVARPTFPEAELVLLRRELIAEIIETRDDDRSLDRAGRPHQRNQYGGQRRPAGARQGGR